MLLATQQSKGSVFAGTFGALAVMTVISVGIGQVFHVAEEASGALLSSDVPWDDYLAIALLLFFGVQTILSAEEETAEEEEEDAKIAVAGMEFDGAAALIISTFVLVFAAEWGDKSFIATIALSAAASPWASRSVPPATASQPASPCLSACSGTSSPSASSSTPGVRSSSSSPSPPRWTSSEKRRLFVGG